MRRPTWRILHGDAKKTLDSLKERSVHVLCTSVPFFLVRDYETKGQLGLEETPELWVKGQVEVFRSARRVLRDDGVAFIVCGDAYWTSRSFAGSGEDTDGVFGRKHKNMKGVTGRRLPKHHDLKEGDLTLQAALLAQELRKDGWYLRGFVIMSFTNPTPESTRNRPVLTHQYCIIVTKQRSGYFWDHYGSREPAVDPGTFRNRRAIWELNTETPPTIKGPGLGKDGFKHRAAYPRKFVDICLSAAVSEKGACPECGAQWVRRLSKASGGSTGKAWHDHQKDGVNGNAKRTSSKDYRAPAHVGWKPSCRCPNNKETVPPVVIDPFTGGSTSGVVALSRRCDYIGIDLSKKCVIASRIRLAEHAATLTKDSFDSTRALADQRSLFDHVEDEDPEPKTRPKKTPKPATRPKPKRPVEPKKPAEPKPTESESNEVQQARRHSGLTTVKFGSPDLHRRVADVAKKNGRTLNEELLHTILRASDEGALFLKLTDAQRSAFEEEAASAGSSIEKYLSERVKALVQTDQAAPDSGPGQDPPGRDTQVP